MCRVVDETVEVIDVDDFPDGPQAYEEFVPPTHVRMLQRP